MGVPAPQRTEATVARCSRGEEHVAGFLGTAVATGTAAVLGIQIQKIKQGTKEPSPNEPDVQGHQVANPSAPAQGRLTWLLTLGIITYAAVGAFVVGVWLGRSESAPDLIRAYGLGAVGWLAGAFTAYFHPAE